jgi:hypothetical protein
VFRICFSGTSSSSTSLSISKCSIASVNMRREDIAISGTTLRPPKMSSFCDRDRSELGSDSAILSCPSSLEKCIAFNCSTPARGSCNEHLIFALAPSFSKSRVSHRSKVTAFTIHACSRSPLLKSRSRDYTNARLKTSTSNAVKAVVFSGRTDICEVFLPLSALRL